MSSIVQSITIDQYTLEPEKLRNVGKEFSKYCAFNASIQFNEAVIPQSDVSDY